MFGNNEENFSSAHKMRRKFFMLGVVVKLPSETVRKLAKPRENRVV